MIEGIEGISAAPQAKRSDSLGQPEFLRLMITQLQNQDPFSPMDNGEFLGQMAQFGTVSGIQELQQSFAGLSSSLISHQALQGAALIGRDALVASQQMRFSGESVAAAVDVPVEGGLSIAIYDEGGTLVRRMDMGVQQRGMANFAWDGRDASGQVVAAGTYFMEAEFDYGGTMVALETLLYGRVNSVSFSRDGSGLKLDVQNMGEVALSSVRRIS